MATAENGKLEYEGGQEAVPMSALTDSGDNTTFTSTVTLWSGRSGYAPVIRPNGILTGGAVIPAVSGTDDLVDVAALTCNLAGVVTTVTADTDVSITRPATDVAKICSITIDNAGTVAVIAGTDGATTTHNQTRGAAGGPPFVPTDSIEVAQVHLVTSASAAIAESEVFQVVGLHRERADYPQYEVDYDSGSIMFLTSVSAIHTGALPKEIYASYSSPIFAEVALASDFTPPETTNSVTSTQIYNTTLGSSSSTLGQGGFTAYLTNGITDTLVTLANELLWFRFYPDRYNSSYIITQGKLGISRTFPADNEIQAACTISSTQAAAGVS